MFVFAAVTIAGALVFIIGNQRNFFSRKTTYHANFDDVAGLQTGSPVRVAGVTVGTVSDVEIKESGKIKVEMEVINDATHMIRRGSEAAIGTKGLLGDKLIEITVGDPAEPIWNSNDPIPPQEAKGIMDSAERALHEVEGTAHNLRLATDPFADQAFSLDLKTTARNLAKISGMIAEGNGTVGRLIRDPKLGDDVAQAIISFRGAADEFSKLAQNLQDITQEVKTGDGTAHAIIYGEDGKKALANLRDASDKVAAIMDKVNKGQGTIGALLVDPSLYEDLKRLVGDLQRNEILRSLVRYSIKRDEARERIDVKDVKEDTKK
jgi:phospholipid/cholesterol/gamma-HCH transport system substrate-binding protein